MARRSYAEKLGLPIIAKFVSYAVVGVPPEIMGNSYITLKIDPNLILTTKTTGNYYCNSNSH
jgi:membrane protein YqaA with SNARE-associated domain